MSILGLSRWNKNWNVRNSYSYVATANKIRFHFQFPRSPDAEFGWLFNWKCKFSCRMISKIANYLKYNYFLEGDGIENVTSRLWKFSYFCSRHTVGVAGDDIMFHMLVAIYEHCFWSCIWNICLKNKFALFGNQRANPFIKISLGKILQPYVNVFICSCLPLLWYIDIPSINTLLW